MSEPKKYNLEPIGLFETVFRTGKLKGKKGFTGKMSAEQYNLIAGKLGPGSGVFLTLNEFKTKDNQPTYRLTFSEPPAPEQEF